MNCEELDKRTKAYKDCIEASEETKEVTQEELEEAHEEKFSSGLGDAVAKVTKATGIDKVIKWVAGEDCGCEERQKLLNKLRFRRTPKCFLEAEYNDLTKIFSKHITEIGRDEQKRLVQIEERIFNKRYSGEPCGNCGEMRRIYNDLKEIYDKYNL